MCLRKLIILKLLTELQLKSLKLFLIFSKIVVLNVINWGFIIKSANIDFFN